MKIRHHHLDRTFILSNADNLACKFPKEAFSFGKPFLSKEKPFSLIKLSLQESLMKEKGFSLERKGLPKEKAYFGNLQAKFSALLKINVRDGGAGFSFIPQRFYWFQLRRSPCGIKPAYHACSDPKGHTKE